MKYFKDQIMWSVFERQGIHETHGVHGHTLHLDTEQYLIKDLF